MSFHCKFNLALLLIIFSIITIPAIILGLIIFYSGEYSFGFIITFISLSLLMRLCFYELLICDEGVYYKSFLKYSFIKWDDVIKHEIEFSLGGNRSSYSLLVYSKESEEQKLIINVKIFHGDGLTILENLLEESVKKNKLK